jgi:hypothetical protein
MSDFKAFLSWTYTPKTVRDRSKIIEDLASFVLDGLVSKYSNEPHAVARGFTDGVRSAILVAHQPHMDMPKKYKVDEGDTSDLLIEAFKDSRRRSMYDTFLATPPIRDEVVSKRFSDAFDTEVMKTWVEAKPSVEGAFMKASENLAVANTRIVALFAIHNLIRQTEFGARGDLPGFAAISDALRQVRQGFLLHYAMFGGLMGGDTAKRVAQALATEACHKPAGSDIQFSVIQFLQGDERSPGRWMSATCDALRADIKEKYDALETK